MKEVSGLIGTGSIGQAIIRRVSSGRHVVLADYNTTNAERVVETLENGGCTASYWYGDLQYLKVTHRTAHRRLKFSATHGNINLARRTIEAASHC